MEVYVVELRARSGTWNTHFLTGSGHNPVAVQICFSYLLGFLCKAWSFGRAHKHFKRADAIISNITTFWLMRCLIQKGPCPLLLTEQSMVALRGCLWHIWCKPRTQVRQVSTGSVHDHTGQDWRPPLILPMGVWGSKTLRFYSEHPQSFHFKTTRKPEEGEGRIKGVESSWFYFPFS